MKLLKVSVPNFRNLKNVDLTFEPSLKPAVFPIGSENGGGKSTLLQLIFVLLTCSFDDDKNIYLSNLLSSVTDDFLIAKLKFIYQEEIIDLTFGCVTENNNEYKEIIQLVKSYNKHNSQIKTIKNIRSYLSSSEEKQIRELQEEMTEIESKILQQKKNKKALRINPLNNHKIYMITKTSFDDFEIAYEALKFLNKHIYLVTPPTQIFLFLDRTIKKMINTDFAKYYEKINDVIKNISNIYIYNKLSIIEIVNSFKKARDKDFQTAINNDGLEYGTALKELAEDFHDFLGNDKYIKPSSDMTSIIVKRKISDNEFIELEPEELSHGELKRLGLYAWIKYNNINDSIILIDEIENGLHPDWQYNIVNELASWGDNQYLLATHSFYLCEALTPGHVKEIEPKMLNPNSED
ncbi:MAG: AAA family ATPase [Crocosphaera sp.]